MRLVVDANELFAGIITKGALSKNIVIYPPRRSQSTQSFRTVSILADFPDGSAFSVCSAVKFKDIVISLENSTVPTKGK
jgi:hypothetical protein